MPASVSSSFHMEEPPVEKQRRPSCDSEASTVSSSSTIKSFPSSQPRLTWSDSNKKGILESGWDPTMGTKVSFVSENSKIGLIVEPETPSAGLLSPESCGGLSCWSYWYHVTVPSQWEAHGLFFAVDPTTGKVDLIHRVKPFRGKELERRTYKNCTFIGIGSEKSDDKSSPMYGKEESVFVVSTEYCDKVIPTGVDVLHKGLAEYACMIDAINDWIEQSVSPPPVCGRLSGLIQPSVPTAMQAYPIAPIVTDDAPPTVSAPVPCSSSHPSSSSTSSSSSGLHAMPFRPSRPTRHSPAYAPLSDTPAAAIDEEDEEGHTPTPVADLPSDYIPSPVPLSPLALSAIHVCAECLVVRDEQPITDDERRVSAVVLEEPPVEVVAQGPAR